MLYIQSIQCNGDTRRDYHMHSHGAGYLWGLHIIRRHRLGGVRRDVRGLLRTSLCTKDCGRTVLLDIRKVAYLLACLFWHGNLRILPCFHPYEIWIVLAD